MALVAEAAMRELAAVLSKAEAMLPLTALRVLGELASRVHGQARRARGRGPRRHRGHARKGRGRGRRRGQVQGRGGAMGAGAKVQPIF